MSQFSDKDLILVAGASSGIGRATALLLNHLGARVVAVARTEEKLISLKAEAEYSEKMFYAVRDVSLDHEGTSSFIGELVKQYGKFSGFVHSVGIIDYSPLAVQDVETANKIFHTNYFAMVFLMKALTNKKNRQELFSAVAVSSISSCFGEPALGIYSASKGALNSTVKSLAAELGRYNVRINAVLPGGIIKMKSLQGLENVEIQGLCSSVLKTDNKMRYVCNLIAFLLAEESFWITGQGIVIDGGETL